MSARAPRRLLPVRWLRPRTLSRADRRSAGREPARLHREIPALRIFVSLIIKKPQGWGVALDACRILRRGKAIARTAKMSFAAIARPPFTFLPSEKAGGCNRSAFLFQVEGADIVVNVPPSLEPSPRCQVMLSNERDPAIMPNLLSFLFYETETR